MNLIDKEKTVQEKIDAVSLVRCKDCIFYHKEACSMDDFHFLETMDDDFCSFGRRKKDASD